MECQLKKNSDHFLHGLVICKKGCVKKHAKFWRFGRSTRDRSEVLRPRGRATHVLSRVAPPRPGTAPLLRCVTESYLGACLHRVPKGSPSVRLAAAGRRHVSRRTRHA